MPAAPVVPARANQIRPATEIVPQCLRGVGYVGYAKSLYAQDWFDSSTERTVANPLDDEPVVASWARLQRDDLPILWSEDRSYNPDFIAIEQSAIHGIIEVKMDKEVGSDEVQAKREAAQRWANSVNADDTVETTWRYLLASEHDVETAMGSWDALKVRAELDPTDGRSPHGCGERPSATWSTALDSA